MKYTALVLVVAALVVGAPSAFGEESSDTSVQPVRAELRTLSPAEAEARREAMQQKAEMLREQAKDALEAKREEVQARLETKREELKTTFEARREEIKEAIQEHREAFVENAQDRLEVRNERRTEIADKLETRASARVGQYLDRFTTILDATIARMYGIIDRITARADAMDAEGAETGTAREYLDLAVSELVAAEADLASIEAQIDASLASDANTAEAIRSLFAGTKEVLESAKQHIRAAHDALNSAVDALKTATVSGSEGE